MSYKFTSDGRHLGKGISWRKGQGVPKGFPIEDMLASGAIELVSETPPEPQKGTSKPKTAKTEHNYTDMSYKELGDEIERRGLTYVRSKDDRIDCLLLDDIGGAND